MANKNLTEMVFILDRSGSMSGLEKDTIGGYNSLIKKQKEEDGDAVVTLVLFDDQYDIIHDRIDIKKVKPITNKQYFARGTTGLLDAVGKTINYVGNRHKNALDSEVPSKTMITIITDGMENASRKFNFRQIKHMIERQKEKYGWEFIFLGANIDAVSAAADIGITSDRAATYRADTKGTRTNFDAVNNVACCMRQRAPISKKWKDSIEKYAKRHRK